MPFTEIRINKRKVYLHPSKTQPDFEAKPVLSGDPWKHVALWLKRQQNEEAVFYWEQAHQFYQATAQLPETSSPLTSYYCFLNATKALLEERGIDYGDRHGISGEKESGNKSLKNEIVEFSSGGVFGGLCELLGETVSEDESCSLYKILFHLPFVHRAFQLTYRTAPTLFIPLTVAKHVIKEGSREAWFYSELNEKYTNKATTRMLPDGFEKDEGVDNSFAARKKQRFEWEGEDDDSSMERLKTHNASVRGHVFPIFADENRWYLKKQGEMSKGVDKSLLPLQLGAMHRLSELARYNPLSLSGHLELQHNWLLTEFLQVSPAQFIHHIACEITGRNLITPDAFRAE